MMKDFIECTQYESKVLIRVASIDVVRDHDIYLVGDDDKGLHVSENFEEIKAKIEEAYNGI